MEKLHTRSTETQATSPSEQSDIQFAETQPASPQAQPDLLHENHRENSRTLGHKVISVAQDKSETSASIPPSTEDTRPETTERAPKINLAERVKHYGTEYYTIEQQFKQYQAKRDRTAPDAAEKYRKSLLNYEDDIAFTYAQLEKATREAQAARAISSIYHQAQVQDIVGSIEPNETIEAAVSDFYDERIADIQKLVLAHPDWSPEEKSAKMQLLSRTWSRVNTYLEATKDTERLHENYDEYHKIRNSCHNYMIKQLNDVNDLARAVGTKPLTPRNFMTNDFEYHQHRDIGMTLHRRAEYDRETVLAYFSKVFSKDFNEIEEKVTGYSRNTYIGR